MDTPSEIPVSSDSRQVAQWIWRNLVPKSGQCDTVQGELLRAVEKLPWEARNNGNINWDSGFELLIDFLERTLCNEPEIADDVKESIRDDLGVLRDNEFPYTEEDLYENLTEAVIVFCRVHPQLIPKPTDPLLHR